MIIMVTKDLTNNTFNEWVFNENLYSFYGFTKDYKLDDIFSSFLTSVHNKSNLLDNRTPIYNILNIFFNSIKSVLSKPFYYNRFILYANNSYLDMLGDEYGFKRIFRYPFDNYDLIKSLDDDEYRSYLFESIFDLNFNIDTLTNYYNLDLFIKSKNQDLTNNIHYDFTRFLQVNIKYKYSKNLKDNYYDTNSSSQLGSYITELDSFNISNSMKNLELVSTDYDCFIAKNLFKYHIPVYKLNIEYYLLKDNSSFNKMNDRFKECVYPFLSYFDIIDNKCHFKIDNYYPLSNTSSDKPLRLYLTFYSFEIKDEDTESTRIIFEEVIDLNNETKTYFNSFILNEEFIYSLNNKFKSLRIELKIDNSLFWNDFVSRIDIFYPIAFNDYFIPTYKFFNTFNYYLDDFNSIDYNKNVNNDVKTRNNYSLNNLDQYDLFFNFEDNPLRHRYRSLSSIRKTLSTTYDDTKMLNFIETFN